MAKQVGPLFITGTIDGIIFYKLNGKYYMRSKGDYRSGKQMRKDPYLKRTMANADQFGVASKLVKPLYYRLLPPEVRKHGLFGKLTGMVSCWLRQGMKIEEAEEALTAYCQTLAPTTSLDTTPTLETAATQSTKPVRQQTLPANQKTKKARYLSNWKVKRNGRLHIPNSAKLLPSIQPAISDIARPLKE